MPKVVITIPTALRFYTVPGKDTARCPRTEEMQYLRRGDVVCLGGQELLVVTLTKEEVFFMRKQEYKVRLFGGLPYMRWLASWDEDAPAPQRARPLRRTKPIWRNIYIPAGVTGFLLYQSYAEGHAASSATPPPVA